jgi:hypothetical protein
VSTFAVVVGVPVYFLWVAGLAAATGWLWGAWAGTAALVSIPLVGLVGLWLRERWRSTWRDIRSFLRMRTHRARIESLRRRQQELAASLRQAYRRHRDEPGARGF